MVALLDLGVLSQLAHAEGLSGRNWAVHDSLLIPRRIYALATLLWPIIVLALVRSRRAKDACR